VNLSVQINVNAELIHLWDLKRQVLEIVILEIVILEIVIVLVTSTFLIFF